MAHCRLLDEMSAARPEGNNVEKDNVVRLIELVGRHLGMTPQGTVTGDQWLARLGVSLFLIQLMARWSSDVVTRYVVEVPLDNISSIYKGEAATKELHTLLEEAHRSGELSERATREMKDTYRDAFTAELKQDLARASAVGPTVSLPFVVENQGEKTHMVANLAKFFFQC